MPPPSYPHRHLLLSQLLDAQVPDPPSSAFTVAGPSRGSLTDQSRLTESGRARLPSIDGGEENSDQKREEEEKLRGRKLDALLLSGWASNAGNGKGKGVDRDVLQHAENLRLKVADFDTLGRIGEGQFGNVDAVRCKLDGKVYAMKTITKITATRAGEQLNLKLERHIHRLSTLASTKTSSLAPVSGFGLSPQRIQPAPAPAPRLVAAFQSPESLHLVITYAPCGSLWDRMCGGGSEAQSMDEVEAAWWAAQMVLAVSWVHDQGFAHRDIKPHNFLVHNNGRLELTDFGSAAPIHSGRVPMAHCVLPAGTPDYVAPEILRVAEDAMLNLHYDAVQPGNGARGRGQANEEDLDPDKTVRPGSESGSREPKYGYGKEVDWWSLGSTMYEMVTGKAPFWASSIKQTYDKIMRYDVRIPDCSQGLRSLLSGLLSPPDVRLGRNGVDEVQACSFFRDVDWDAFSLGKARPPPGFDLPQTIDLQTLSDAFDQSESESQSGQMLGGIDEMTFDHFFNSTTIGVDMLTSVDTMSPLQPSKSAIEPPIAATAAALEPTLVRWVGWSLDPPSDYFGHEPPSPTLAPISTHAVAHARGLSTSPPTRPGQPPYPFVTPIRPTPGGQFGPGSVSRSAPRSVPRTRPVSERQAYAQLVACVQASARKKLNSSLSRQMPGKQSVSPQDSTSGSGNEQRQGPGRIVDGDLGEVMKDAQGYTRPSSRLSLFSGQRMASGDGDERGRLSDPPFSASSSTGSMIARQPPTPTPIPRSRDASINVTGHVSNQVGHSDLAAQRPASRGAVGRRHEERAESGKQAAVSEWIRSTAASTAPSSGPGAGLDTGASSGFGVNERAKGGSREKQMERMEKWYGQIEEGYRDLEDRVHELTKRLQKSM